MASSTPPQDWKKVFAGVEGHSDSPVARLARGIAKMAPIIDPVS